MNLTNKRLNIYRILAWLPAIFVMCLIFMFSCENAAESTNTSSGFVERLIALFYPDFASKTVSQREEITYMFTVIVRKGAHFAIYAMLGFCVAFAMSLYNLTTMAKNTVSFVICFLYAISDEVHQLFSSGRACRIGDIAIDSGGALIGIGVYFIMYALINNYLVKRRKQYAKN